MYQNRPLRVNGRQASKPRKNIDFERISLHNGENRRTRRGPQRGDKGTGRKTCPAEWCRIHQGVFYGSPGFAKNLTVAAEEWTTRNEGR